jgi:hypothetical protein
MQGKENGPADTLSRMHEDATREPKLTPLISPDAFLNVFEAGDPGMLKYEVIQGQWKHKKTMREWEGRIDLYVEEGPHEKVWKDKRGRLMVPPDDALKRKILKQLHDHWGAGHPGRDKTMHRVQRQYT